MRLLLVATVLAAEILLLAPAPAAAQNSPPPQDQGLPPAELELRLRARNEEGRPFLDENVPLADDPERAPLALSERPANRAPLSAEEAAQTVSLTGITLQGNTLFDLDEISGLWEAELGSETTVLRLDEIASEVQSFFRQEGYVFARAALVQDGFPSGVATIRVVEGAIGTVTVEESAGDVGPVKSLLDDMAAKLAGVERPHISQLERVLLLMNDVPGITRATAIPRRSQTGQAGLIDVIINVERRPVSGVVFADSRQSPSAGQGLLGAAVEYSSYSSGADTTRLTATTSFWDGTEDLSERQVVQIEHSRHILADGLTVSARGLYSRSSLGDDLEVLDISGEQFEFEIGADYPILRTRPLSINSFASFTLTESTNDIGNATLSDDSLRVFTVGLEGLMRDSTGFTGAELGVRQGIPALGSSEAGVGLPSRGDADPSATVFYGEIERDQQIYGPVSVYGRAAGQYSTRGLYASQEFQIGGTTFGRGFDPSEFTGDSGYGLSGEVRFTDGISGLSFFGSEYLLPRQFQIYGFFDYGSVFNNDGDDNSELASYGGGARLTLPQSVFLELEVAKPTAALARESADGDSFRVFFSAQKQF